jgi:hypothetical protein
VANRHNWLSWDQYHAAHLSNLARFPTFVVDDRLTWLVGTTLVEWEGHLRCVDGVEIWVARTQDISRPAGRPPQVKTRLYSYHVQRREADVVRQVLRYDNAHPHLSHADAHHKHTFINGVDTINHIGVDGWPTLGDVIAEVEALWAGGRFK